MKTGVKMGGARPDGENVGWDWAAQDEASRADVAGERQRGGQRWRGGGSRRAPALKVKVLSGGLGGGP